MRIINQDYDILRLDKERDIEMITRGYCVCYNTPVPDTYEKQCEFVKKHRHHESQLEHSIMTVLFRWCNYSGSRFDNQLTFINNSHIVTNSTAYEVWLEGLRRVEIEYLQRLALGQRVDEARGCLPKDLATKLLISTNFREWRAIFKLRCDSPAHYQMREVMCPLLDELKVELPCVFDDISY